MAYLPIFTQTNTVYFYGLPPIPKGEILYADGVPSYLLTVEQAINDFYTKTLSDARYVKLAGGTMTGNLFFKKATIGTLGVYWYNTSNQLTSSVEGNSGGVQIGYYNPDNPSDNYSLNVAKDHIAPSRDLGLPGINSLDLLSAKYGVRKNAPQGAVIDDINFNDGNYIYRNGIIYLKNSIGETIGSIDFTGTVPIISLLGGETSGGYVQANTPADNNDYILVNKGYAKSNFLPLNLTENIIGQLSGYTTELKNGIWKFTCIFEDGNSLVFDMTGELGILDAGEWITKLGIVQDGTWTNLPAGDSLFDYPTDSKKFAQIGHVNSVGTIFDAIVKSGTVYSSSHEYNTVREAIIAGKKHILIKPGTYSSTSFWPVVGTQSLTDVTIEGENYASTIIEGPSVVSSGVGRVISLWTFKNITFRLAVGNYASQKAFTFNDGEANYGGYNNIKFENCLFDGYDKVSGGYPAENVGFDLYFLSAAPGVTFESCKFIHLDTGIRSAERFSVSLPWHHSYFIGLVINNCKFWQLYSGVIPFYFIKTKITNSNFNEIYTAGINCTSSLEYSGFEYQGDGRCGLEISGNTVADTVDTFINVNHGGDKNNWDKSFYSETSDKDRGRAIGNAVGGDDLYFHREASSSDRKIYKITNLTSPNTPTAIYDLKNDNGGANNKEFYGMFAAADTDIFFYPTGAIDASTQAIYSIIYRVGVWSAGDPLGITDAMYHAGWPDNFIRFGEYGYFTGNRFSWAIAWTQNHTTTSGVAGNEYPCFAVWSEDNTWHEYTLVDETYTPTRPTLTGLTHWVEYQGGNPYDTYVFISGLKRTSSGTQLGGVFYRKFTYVDPAHPTYQYMYTSLLPYTGTTYFTDNIYYIKCLEHSGVPYVYVNHVDGDSKLYRATADDVIDAPGSASWELVYTFPSTDYVVLDIMKDPDSTKTDNFYLTTKHGVMYFNGTKDSDGGFPVPRNIGPSNVGSSDFNVGVASPTLAVYNDSGIVGQKAVMLSYFADGNLNIITNPLVNNPDQIYDNYKNGKLQITNNNIGTTVMLNTEFANDEEELDLTEHKYLITGNKKEYGVGITESTHVTAASVGYILGHTKKVTGVPIESEFEKSNIVDD